MEMRPVTGTSAPRWRGASVGERLGQVQILHRDASVEVGDGARHPQGPVVGACREAQAPDCAVMRMPDAPTGCTLLA